MLHVLVITSAFVLVIHGALVNAARNAQTCHDLTPSKPQHVRITGYPDPWSLSLSWSAPAQCVDYYYVFVRNGGVLPQGLKDFKPDQVIKTKKSFVAVYKLKANWKYRVDVVAVSSRHGRSGYATVFATTPKDMRYPTPAPSPAVKTPPAALRPPPLLSGSKPPGHSTTTKVKPPSKWQQQQQHQHKPPTSSPVPQTSSVKPPQKISKKSPIANPWSAPAKRSSPAPAPLAAAASPGASPVTPTAQQLPAHTATGSAPACGPSRTLAAPVNVAAVFVGGGSDKVRVTWRAPVLPSCGYSLLGYKLTGVDSRGATILNTPLKTSERDVTITRLNSATTYTFKVVALSMQGEGVPATIAVNPSAGSVSVTGSAAAAVLYSPPAAAAISPAATPPSAARGTIAPASSTASPPSRPAAAQQVPGSSPLPGVQTNFGCRGDSKPAAPQHFTAVAYGTGMIKLRWSNGDTSICTESFQLDGYVLKTGDPVVTTLTGNMSYTLTKLEPGTEYAFTVAAKNPKGRGRPATAFVSTTKDGR